MKKRRKEMATEVLEEGEELHTTTENPHVNKKNQSRRAIGPESVWCLVLCIALERGAESRGVEV